MAKAMLSWMLTGGSVSVPKRLMAFLDILDLSFEQVGQLMYLLYLEGKVDKKEQLLHTFSNSYTKSWSNDK